jgi:hypothetical protein
MRQTQPVDANFRRCDARHDIGIRVYRAIMEDSRA